MTALILIIFLVIVLAYAELEVDMEIFGYEIKIISSADKPFKFTTKKVEK